MLWILAFAFVRVGGVVLGGGNGEVGDGASSLFSCFQSAKRHNQQLRDFQCSMAVSVSLPVCGLLLFLLSLLCLLLSVIAVAWKVA